MCTNLAVGGAALKVQGCVQKDGDNTDEVNVEYYLSYMMDFRMIFGSSLSRLAFGTVFCSPDC